MYNTSLKLVCNVFFINSDSISTLQHGRCMHNQAKQTELVLSNQNFIECKQVTVPSSTQLHFTMTSVHTKGNSEFSVVVGFSSI